MKITPNRMRWLMNIWPPFLGAGIRVRRISEDFREAHVELRQGWLNRNYVGTHFGGSLFAMTDPFYMLLLLQCLGRDYIVWDKDSRIRFVKPGRGTVHAVFRLPESVLAEIKAEADGKGKCEPVLHVDVLDRDGEVVAEVEKTLYVRRKA
ncbi:MAG: DUF4442 domain-containing protein [Gammaproteobacteria bacterium]|nr:DUF4442 domain-containing protein [Gammaproteobacteria bacterium]